ncbi:MAG: hypothetical protein J5965_25735 [Aeriscardovia sp.]|nr:hypothetical protein [Aeriscardovia sp.]
MEDITRIPYITIVFENRLMQREIPLFRGAIISKVPERYVLFHNHLNSGFRFAYPLIQYKLINGKAALFCIGKGTDEIRHFFSNSDMHLSIGEKESIFKVENTWAKQWILQTWNDSFSYSLHRWVPFNKNNYNKYLNSEGLIEKVNLLESILIGNILSMSNTLGHHFDSPVECKIIKVNNPRPYYHKGILLQGFDILFNTNVYLPNYIGIGKGASMGFGVIKQSGTIKDKKNELYGNE